MLTLIAFFRWLRENFGPAQEGPTGEPEPED